MTMLEIKNTFERIKNVPGKNDKRAIIEENKDDKEFCDTLKFLLSPYTVTGISTKRMQKEQKDKMIENNFSKPEDWFALKDYMLANNTGSMLVVNTVKNFIKQQPEEMKQFYADLVTKTYKLGCNARTVNSVIPNLVPEFNIQKGTSIKDCKIKDGEYFYISQKLNGNRVIYKDGKLYSRKGAELTGLGHIIADIKKLINTVDNYLMYDDVVFDGELIGKNSEGLGDSENFQKSNGIINSKKGDKISLKMVIFDIIKKENFESNKDNTPYSVRNCLLYDYKAGIEEEKLVNVGIVPMFYEGTDQTEIQKWLEYAEKHDFEGIMVNLDTPYEFKRTKNLIKVKVFNDIDLRCVGVNIAETGEFAGLVGSITCKFGDGTVDVGSGMKVSDRKLFKENPNAVIGKIITVRYKEITTNKQGGKSLQFPVFVCVREDKDIPTDEE